MTKDKQIEEMARIICKSTSNKGNCEKCGFKKSCSRFEDAEALYNAGYRKQSEWISVDERLPEKHTRVLCYFKYESESLDIICENFYYGSDLWLSEGSKVTHWMPLPQPPKMKGGEADA